jgi:hypothetical protein
MLQILAAAAAAAAAVAAAADVAVVVFVKISTYLQSQRFLSTIFYNCLPKIVNNIFS